MQRNKSPKAEKASKKVKWVKVGGGLFTLKDGTVVRPGDTFDAPEEEIPAAFSDLFKRASVQEDVENEDEDVLVYKLKEAGGGLYNVVDQDDEAVNEKPLGLEEAEKLLKELETV